MPAVSSPAKRSASAITSRMPRSSMSRIVKICAPDSLMSLRSLESRSRTPTSATLRGSIIGFTPARSTSSGGP